MKLDKPIRDEGKRFAKENKELIKLIEKYDRICVFRHIRPDFDALGSQMGLVTWLKDNFPNKEVRFVGDNHVTFTPRLFPEMDKLSDSWFNQPFLAIVVDVANLPRIADPRFEKAEAIVTIDHHPHTDTFANIHITDVNCAAASELVVALLLNHKKYKLSKKAAEYFYIALVGDSGRFQYSSTTSLTFAIAGNLLNTGLKISDIYQNMYLKQIDDLVVTAYILNHYTISPKGVAYYLLDEKVQKDLKITTERGKENVNLFSNIEGINIWCSITQDTSPNEPCWRISIRSRNYKVNGVATEFGGGGHDLAAGAKIDTLDDLPRFIEALDKLIK